jgi:hypothetical protein
MTHSPVKSAAIFFFGLLATAAVGLLGLFIYLQEVRSLVQTDSAARYHAIFLTNGQVFFGHIIDARKQNIRLGDVYYIQTRMNPQTKETTNVLVLRGKEWHRPSHTSINMQHVLWVEAVAEDSEVANLISKLKMQK